MRISNNQKTAIFSRVSVDWLEFTLFSRKPDILRGENMDFLDSIKPGYSGTGTVDQEEVERLLKKHRPGQSEKEQEQYQSFPFTVSQACALLGKYGFKPEKQERGAQGYNSRHITQAGVVILSGGTGEMGLHVRFSGEVCQKVENITELIKSVKEEGAQFTRIDLAIDDCDGALDLRHMVEKCRGGECSSRLKTFLVMEGGKIKDGESTGLTLYIGKKISDFMCRIYDKRLESINEKGISQDDLPEHWIRAEMECKATAANNTAAQLVAGAKLPELAAGILSNYVSFKDRGEDENKSRWKMSQFWIDFINGAKKLSVSKVIIESDIDKRAKWFIKQCASTVAILLKTHGPEKMTNAVVHAGLNLSDKQRFEIKTYKRKRAHRRKMDAAQTG